MDSLTSMKGMCSDLAEVGIWTLNLRKRGLLVSDEFAKILGYKKNGFKRSFAFFKSRIHPEDVVFIEKTVFSGGKGAKRKRKKECRILNKKGKYIWISIKSKVAKRSSSGRPIEIIGVITDISKYKKTEIANQELLNSLNLKNEELKKFTYTVSHDLKGPIATIRGFVGILKKEYADEKDPQLVKYMEHIESAGDKMNLLIEEILRLSRVGYSLKKKEKVNLYDIAKEAVSIYEQEIDSKNITVEIDKTMPFVYGDYIKLFEVVQNLLDNSIKFIGENKKPLIKIGHIKVKGKQVFYVKDNGMGVDPKFHRMIFGIFNKAHSGFKGTGLGLTLVKRVIELHGGDLWVESNGKDKGTAFYFSIPKKQDR